MNSQCETNHVDNSPDVLSVGRLILAPTTAAFASSGTYPVIMDPQRKSHSRLARRIESSFRWGAISADSSSYTIMLTKLIDSSTLVLSFLVLFRPTGSSYQLCYLVRSKTSCRIELYRCRKSSFLYHSMVAKGSYSMYQGPPSKQVGAEPSPFRLQGRLERDPTVWITPRSFNNLSQIVLAP